MPKVSIVMPIYNGKKYIEKAVESILIQAFSDFELIIIDDGSTDGSGELLKDKFGDKIKYVYQKNKGAAAAVNKGISLSLGGYIAFCDQDDWWLPEKLKRQVDFLEGNKGMAMVYGDALMADENGKILDETWMQLRAVRYYEGSYSDCVVRLFDRNFICAPLSVLVRKNVFDAIGLFNEKFSSAYDYDYWFRLLEAGFKIGYIKEPLVVWRTHEGQKSRDIHRAKAMQIGILKSFLKRKPEFSTQHPFLVIKKFIKSYTALFLSNK
ncbi:MAG: glycosyltransferase [Elusimicrobia bacterium]|nr:glycosyltransferase [Elusimicrobiota bacterium]